MAGTTEELTGTANESSAKSSPNNRSIQSDTDEAFVGRLIASLPCSSGKRSINVLEIGSGAGKEIRSLRRRRPDCNYTALDRVDGERFARSAENLSKLEGEGWARTVAHKLPDPLPFRDGEFDLVFARLSLHYFPEMVLRDQILPELHRVMGRDGILLFTIKTAENYSNPGEFTRKFGDAKVFLTVECWEGLLVGGNGFRLKKSDKAPGFGFSTTHGNDMEWKDAGSPWSFEVIKR